MIEVEIIDDNNSNGVEEIGGIEEIGGLDNKQQIDMNFSYNY